ncbi:MAG: hypothetical protein GXO12_04715, partial [Epsilonproteobacteria bacterium]|nr:hypothetical protein [Campylobacterota bacterium]
MKILFFIILLSSQILFGKSFYLSDIPLPDTQIIDLSIKKCDIKCLKELISDGQVFSFLSKYSDQYNDENLTNSYKTLKLSLNIKGGASVGSVNIALLFPKKIIGRYAISTANSVLAYLLNKNINFKLELFDCQDETLPNIEKT